MKNIKGFSLIELMITVAIIGILSLMALPIFKEYRNRVIVAEGLTLSSTLKSDLLEFFTENGLDSLTALGGTDFEYTIKFNNEFFDEVDDPNMPGMPILKQRYPISSNFVQSIIPSMSYNRGGVVSSFNIHIRFKENVFDNVNSLHWGARGIIVKILLRGSYYDKNGRLLYVDVGTGQNPKMLCGQDASGISPTDPIFRSSSIPRNWLPLGCRDLLVSFVYHEDGALNFTPENWDGT